MYLAVLWLMLFCSIAHGCGFGSPDFQTYRVTAEGFVEYCNFAWTPVCLSDYWTETEGRVACTQQGACTGPGLCEATISGEATGSATDLAVECQGDETDLIECTRVSEPVTCHTDANNNNLRVKVSCAVADPCPNGWVHNSQTGKCYNFLLTDSNWYEGFQECVDIDGNLVRIDSSLELEFLRNYIYDNGLDLLYPRFWTAGNDIVESRNWRNAPDDKSASFGSMAWGWAIGEPNSEDGNERCVNMLGLNERLYYLNDSACNKDAAVICEKTSPKTNAVIKDI